MTYENIRAVPQLVKVHYANDGVAVFINPAHVVCVSPRYDFDGLNGPSKPKLNGEMIVHLINGHQIPISKEDFLFLREFFANRPPLT